MKLRRPEGTATQRLTLRSQRDKLGGRKIIADIEFDESGIGECTKAAGRRLREAFPALEVVKVTDDATEEEDTDGESI